MMRVAAFAFAVITALVFSLPAGAEDRRLVAPEDMLSLRDLNGLSLSPNGKWAAVQVRYADPVADTYRLSWHVISIASGEVLRVMDGGEPVPVVNNGRRNGAFVVPPAVWSPDESAVYFIRGNDGRMHVWSADLGSGQVRQLTNMESDAIALAALSDGRQILARVRPGAPQIAAALEAEGRDGFLFDGRWAPGHSLTPPYPSANVLAKHFESDQWIVELRTGNARRVAQSEQKSVQRALDPASGLNAPHTASLFSAGPGRAAAWAEQLDPGRRGWFAPRTVVARTTTGENVICSARECTSLFLAGIWHRSETELVFAEDAGNRNEGVTLYSWRVGSDEVRRVATLADAALTLEAPRECGVVRDEFVCLLEEPTRPRRLVAIDVNTGEVRTLFEPNASFKEFDIGSSPRKVWFETPSGLKHYAYLVLPPDGPRKQPLPLVIITYRCVGFIRGGTGDEYPVFALAAKGLAVLCVNFPLADYERAETMDMASYESWQRGPGDPAKRRYQEMLEHLVSTLAAEGVVDPQRVAMTGLSLGAESTIYALFNMPLAAAIASGGEIGPSATFLYSESGRRQLRTFGLDTTESPRWRDLSIIHNVERVCAPFLLNVSDHELISRLQFFVALQNADRPIEMHVYKDEYHAKSGPWHMLTIFRRNADWLTYWLLGAVDRAPEKQPQYARWDALRVELASVRRAPACR